MLTLRLAVGAAWLAFWIYWLASARGVKPGGHNVVWLRSRVVIVIAAIVVVRIIHPRAWTFDSPIAGGIGAALFVCGLAIAIWARVNLGRNWGMPMTTTG